MEIIIRKESAQEINDVNTLIEQAFRSEKYSDQSEHHLVSRLRNSDAFIPQLSLVAIAKKCVVGHILFTKIFISDKNHNEISLALAPVSVLPDFQKKGVGSKLIRAGHKIAKELGFTSIVLIGHADYYPRFGYKRASLYRIKVPFEVPDENCMAVELIPGSLKNIMGEVVYAAEFFDV